MFRYCEGSGKM